MKSISSSIHKDDAQDKIRGFTKYLDDHTFEDIFYARTVRSTVPRGVIKKIHIENIPEGYYILDYKKIPGRNFVKIIIEDQPILAEKRVNYIGEPILLIVGKNKDIIMNIIKSIKIEYEVLESVHDYENDSKIKIYKNNNCFDKYNITKGNINTYFSDKENYSIYEETFHTGLQEHIYLEPQSMIAHYDKEIMTIYGSLQGLYYVKYAVMNALNFSSEKVRVIQTATGGAFGGKEEFPSLIASHAAIASYHTGKPVKIVYDRIEDIICTTKRHPSCIKYKVSVNKNNEVSAFDVDIRIDGGAYAGMTGIVLQRAVLAASGVYNIKNLHVSGKGIATNKVPSGAFRGFGGPQIFFAVEMIMDKIAHSLNLNPVEFKKKHYCKKNDTTASGGIYRNSIILEKMTDRIVELSKFNNKYIEFKDYNKKTTASIRKGIGFSAFFHGCGFTGSGERDIIKASIALKYIDGKVYINVSNVEMGQGLSTTFRKIVSHSLDMDIKMVKFNNPDTFHVPDSGPTVASRSIMIVGNLLKLASLDLKKEIIRGKTNIEIKKDYKHPEGLSWNQEQFKGDAYPSYSWGVNVIEVNVNLVTYEVDIIKVWAIFDIGLPIDNLIIKGQIDGGIVQAIGYSKMENMEVINGKLCQINMSDYSVPTSLDIPKIISETAINPYENGPFGAKGAGELTFVGVPGAYAAAVSNAVNKTITRLPVTPEYLMEVLKK